MPCCSIEGQALSQHFDTLASKTNDLLPLSCQWEITCKCNFKCVMCYTDCFNTPEDIKKELSTDEIFKIMGELKAEGVLELTLTGGEPMARSDFKEIYTKAIQSGFLTTIFTNGTYITQDWIETFKEFPPTMIEISYHGAVKSTFDTITKLSGSFERVRAAIELLVTNDVPLTLKATGLTLNEQEILEIKKYTNSLGNVHFRYGQILRPHANGDTDSLKYQLEESVLDRIISEDTELTKDEEKQKKARESDSGDCHSGKRRFHIDAYGNLQLCSENREMGYNLISGNFKEGFFKSLPNFPCPNKKVKRK